MRRLTIMIPEELVAGLEDVAEVSGGNISDVLRDAVTAYLATSPGGADSVAIIAQATPVDVPFVMAMQVLRFVAVLVVGPPLARAVARRLGGGQRGAAGSGEDA